MIIDHLDNADQYIVAGERFAKAFEYLKSTNLYALQPGTYEIDGRQIYILVQQFTTKPKGQCGWEAHRAYADIHYILEGVEQIGYANIHQLTPGDFDQAKDFWVLFGEGNYLTARPGTFVVMFPQDAHMPGLAVDSPLPIKKVVVKVAV